jgi:hypothetical protein
MADAANFTLDDILGRARRLELRSPFLLNNPLPKILQSSRSVLSNVSSTAEVRSRGTLLLAQHRTDLSRTPDILRSVDHNRSAPAASISFTAQTVANFQKSIVDSLLNLQNDVYHEAEPFIGTELAKPVPPPLPPHTFRRELVPHRRFFADLLTDTGGSLPGRFATAIRDSDHLFSDINKRPLADTFFLISQLAADGTRTGTVNYLETQFYRYMTDEVNANLRNADRGGEIGIIGTIRGYLHLLGEERKRNWAFLWFCLRAGQPEAALDFSKTTDFDAGVSVALEARVNGHPIGGHLKSSLAAYLASENMQNDRDPFKILVLSVLTVSGPVPQDRITSIEDWIWVELQIGRDLVELSDQLLAVQDLGDPRNPFVRGQVLLMSGKFQEASEWFQKQKDVADAGFHIGLAICATGLTGCDRYIKPMRDYASEICSSDPIAAVRYISVFPDTASRINTIARVAVHAREGHKLFELFDNGAAPIARILHRDAQKEAAIAAAEKAEQHGHIVKALTFFRLVGGYDRMIDVVCAQLQSAVSGYVGESAIELARDVHEEITENGAPVNRTDLQALEILISLASARIRFQQGKYSKALQLVEETGIFPVSIQELEEYRGRLQVPHQLLKPIIPDVLEMTVAAYAELSHEMRKQPASGEALRSVCERSGVLIRLNGVIDLPDNIGRRLFDLSTEIEA